MPDDEPEASRSDGSSLAEAEREAKDRLTAAPAIRPAVRDPGFRPVWIDSQIEH